MDDRIYTNGKIVTGVFLGGPLAGGYYFWRTFNALGWPKAARWSIVVAVLFLVLCVMSRLTPLLDHIPNSVFWPLQIGLIFAVTRSYLQRALDSRPVLDRPVFGWGNTILVALVCFVLTMGPILALLYLGPETFDPTRAKYYGKLQHEIRYIPSELSEIDVGRVANALTETGFFDEQQQKFVDLSQTGRTLIITISCSEEARSQEVIDMFRQLRDDLQQGFPDKHIVIDMAVDTTGDRIARLE